MAHSLRLRVIAEGVESREQLEYLRDRGCDEVQGFLYSRPQPADVIERWLYEFNKHSKIVEPGMKTLKLQGSFE